MDFLTNAWDTFLGLIKSFQVTDALDIILVSFILYNAIKLVRETRAEQLIKGLLILCVVWAAAFYLQLYMVSNILSYIFNLVSLQSLYCSSLKFGGRWNSWDEKESEQNIGLWAIFQKQRRNRKAVPYLHSGNG
ncbi:MAG: hypothetical protein ACLSCV_07350 [Acutalibacteraceae bacterium]